MNNTNMPPEVRAAVQKLSPERSALIQAVAEGMAETLKPILAGIMARLDALEVLAQGNLKFMGTHQRALASYERGNAVVHEGALWIAVDDAGIGELPGKSMKWQLAVKSGAARDK